MVVCVYLLWFVYLIVSKHSLKFIKDKKLVAPSNEVAKVGAMTTFDEHAKEMDVDIPNPNDGVKGTMQFVKLRKTV